VLRRLAGNCFWMGRYIERAENVARTLGVAERLAHAPEHHRRPGPLWTETLMISCDENQFRKAGLQPDANSVLEWCFLDARNTSSVVSCLHGARDNARTARHLFTNDAWEALNGAWIEVQTWDRTKVESSGGWEDACAWSIRQCLLVRGAFLELARDELPHVITLGQMLERVASIVSVLQLSPIIRLAHQECLPGTALHRRTEATLAMAGGVDTFGRGMRDGLDPLEVVQFLIGDPTSPRSLLVCCRTMVEAIIGMTGGNSDAHARTLPAARALVAAVLAMVEDDAPIAPVLGGIIEKVWALSELVAQEHFSLATSAA